VCWDEGIARSEALASAGPRWTYPPILSDRYNTNAVPPLVSVDSEESEYFFSRHSKGLDPFGQDVARILIGDGER
jgi:hypothetical protein